MHGTQDSFRVMMEKRARDKTGTAAERLHPWASRW